MNKKSKRLFLLRNFKKNDERTQPSAPCISTVNIVEEAEKILDAYVEMRSAEKRVKLSKKEIIFLSVLMISVFFVCTSVLFLLFDKI